MVLRSDVLIGWRYLAITRPKQKEQFRPLVEKDFASRLERSSAAFRRLFQTIVFELDTMKIPIVARILLTAAKVWVLLAWWQARGLSVWERGIALPFARLRSARKLRAAV